VDLARASTSFPREYVRIINHPRRFFEQIFISLAGISTFRSETLHEVTRDSNKLEAERCIDMDMSRVKGKREKIRRK